jgi:hypothetical protein
MTAVAVAAIAALLMAVVAHVFLVRDLSRRYVSERKELLDRIQAPDAVRASLWGESLPSPEKPEAPPDDAAPPESFVTSLLQELESP